MPAMEATEEAIDDLELAVVVALEPDVVGGLEAKQEHLLPEH